MYKRQNFPTKIRVHYFLHPLYQQKVEVVEKKTCCNEQFYLIKFFDQVKYIPIWMTDAQYCNSIEISEKPKCSLKTLFELQLLIK